MKHRKLRIAWSTAWGFVALLLAALWARSFSTVYMITGDLNLEHGFKLESLFGRLNLVSLDYPRRSRLPFTLQSATLVDEDRAYFSTLHSMIGFAAELNRDRCSIVVPYYFLFLLSFTLVATPWLHWSNRFNVRTLLIATTLVAVGLGLIVWLR